MEPAVKYTRLFTLFLCQVCSVYLWAQLELSGLVTDKAEGLALPGVNIILQSETEDLVLVTNVEGKYAVQVAAGIYDIEFRFVGYRTLRQRLELSEDQVLDVGMEAQSLMLNAAVVSASRFEEDFSELTVSMDVLRPDLIQNRNLNSLDAALREIPGMIIIDNEPQIRSGSGYSFGAGSRVQILLDGIPQLSGDIGRPIWDNIPMEAVEQIEVVKGAASVLYGSAALSGVVNVYTDYPSDTARTQLQFFGGTYALPPEGPNRYWNDAQQVHGRTVMHSQRISPQDDFMFSAQLLSDDGHLGPFRDSLGASVDGTSGLSLRHNNVNRSARAWTKWRHRHAKHEGLSYGLMLQGQYSGSVQSLIWDNIDTGLFGAFEGSATTTIQELSNINPFLEKRWKSGHALIWRGNWNRLRNENDNDQSNASDTYFTEAQYRWDGTAHGLDWLQATTGATYQYVEGSGELYNNRGLNPSNESSNLGLYLQTDLRPVNRLKLSLGMRQEWFEVNGQKEDALVFRAGANYRAAEATFIRASYGQGFRFPTIGERFITTQVGALAIFPSEDLQAESSENIELGIKQGFRLGAVEGYVDLALFRQQYADFIEFTFGQWGDPATDPFFGLGFTSLNTGAARIDGAELVLAARTELTAKSSLNLLLGYTYTEPIAESPEQDYSPADASVEVNYLISSSDPSGNILKYRMQHLFRVNLDYAHGKWNLGAGLRYNSFMQNIDRVFLELDFENGPLESGLNRWRAANAGGDAILDVRLGYRFWKQHRFDIIVDNVANHLYSIRPLVLEQNRRVLLRMTLEI